MLEKATRDVTLLETLKKPAAMRQPGEQWARICLDEASSRHRIHCSVRRILPKPQSVVDYIPKAAVAEALREII